MNHSEEEEEEFYESLDRILSSSCSSTSCSDDEAAAAAADPHRRRRRLPPPPSAATSYEVWISEPSSVEERRRRLLQQMGLISDPALSRAGSGSRSGSEPRPDPEPAPAEIGADPDAKPEAEAAAAVSGGGGDEILRCTIRNLDNGEEFVVKEDGILDKVREVGSSGTRRQLTVEEFELCVGRSPIVQELMRRQNVENASSSAGGDGVPRSGARPGGGGTRWKKGGWIRSIKNIAGNVVAGGYYRDQRRSSDERDSSSEKAGRRSSSATDDSQDGSLLQGPERIRVRHYGKPFKEITGLYLTQEIHAHTGSIWSIKFSFDGKYLASAGEDCVIHVWQVTEREKKGDLVAEGGGGENGTSPESALAFSIEGSHWEKKRRARVSTSRKSMSSDHVLVPDQFFALEEKPVCSFRGHLDDVLDLSWSKSEYLLSSSMDKTVRLWHMSSNSCLKTFSHSDYVTCIQFNPVDHDFFISGSLDEKVRIWSIPDRQVVDWNDLHEMVTAACYTPDGKGALVGSHKGSCHLYDTSDNKLHQKSQIDLQNKKKKSSRKKITGFQFAPGSSSEVLITSADSRIRVVDGTELVHKFKGFRNTNSQISASLASNGKYVVCASEDSHVYVWRCDTDSQPTRSRGIVSVSQSYEHFYCQHVTVAVPWPCSSPGVSLRTSSSRQNGLSGVSEANQELLEEASGHESSPPSSFRCSNSPQLGTRSNSFGDRVAATWPEEKLVTSSNQSTPRSSVDTGNGRMQLHSRSAWGMVIVTAGRGGRIRTFQNFGFPA
ncbi:WD repeat-containing protein 44-like [Iris pallida]|uniref:WD repeat-containing protein 44-like n=1 Tax=Iris pallida TaxID=29817 RepID=A0AAX6EPY1_IRIPA|nr:WD repeat-containing protein 44-like [Iris pallida]